MNEETLKKNDVWHRHAPARQRGWLPKARRLRRRHDGVAPVWRANVVYRTFLRSTVTVVLARLGL